MEELKITHKTETSDGATKITELSGSFLGFLVKVLTIIFVALKLERLVQWNWFIVFSPLFASLALCLASPLILLVVILIERIFD